MLRLKRPRPVQTAVVWALAFGLLFTSVAGIPVLAASSAAEESASINMEFSNASLVQVLQMLAEAAGYNVLLDDTVQGAVTFTLRDVRPLEAFELITSLKGYSYRVAGNTLVVGAAVQAPAAAPPPVEVELYRVQHVSLDGAANLLRELYPNLHVIVDSGTSSLILRGEKSLVGEASAFLVNYDRPTDRALQFQRASVETILWELADRARWNLVIEGELQGDLTANLEGMAFQDALALVGDAAGLHYRLSEKVLFVSQPVPEAVPEPSKEIAIFRLDHINADKTAQTLSSMYPNLDVDVNEVTRTLTVAGAASDLSAATRLLRQLDVPRRQVIVEARLEEINVDAMYQFGADWGQDRGVLSASGIDPLVLSWDPSSLMARLEALNREGLSKILASPKLAALDGEPATILIGDRVPLILQSVDDDGRISETIEFIEAGIRLRIVPTIGDDDSVTLEIDSEVSSITAKTDQGVPEIRTREMDTVVRVRNGQPLAIGGLIKEDERERMQGLPFLGDLPILGRLFSSKATEIEQSEMVIFLIPHIVHDGPEPASSAAAGPQGADARDSGGEGGGQAARQEVVLDGSILARSSARNEPEERGVVWADPVAVVQGAYDFRMERRVDSNGFLTGLYVSPGAHGISYGGNVGFRRYFPEVGGLAPWAGLDGEYLTSADGLDRGYTFSANAGIGTRDAEPLLVEFFGQYTLAAEGLNLPSSKLPARWEGLRVGLRVGWEY